MKREDALPAIRGKQIALLIESDGPGGAERIVAELATEFVQHGCPTVVYLPASGEGWLGRELASAGATIEYVSLDRVFSPRFASDLAASFRRNRIEIAHSHDFTMSVYGAWAARKAGIPHVMTMHGGRYYAGRLQRRFALGLAARSSGTVVAVSTELADHLSRDLRFARDRITVIMNGVRQRPRPAHTIRDELGLATSDRLLLAVGNLYPVKGHRHLVNAAAQLRGEFPGLHVAIAGRGENEDSLRAQARDLGITDNVHLLGFRSDIAMLFAGADVFVQPSLSEGLPLAVLEAMFAGLPIVASDVGEIGQVLGGGAGVLVPPGDEGALVGAIGGMLRDPAGAKKISEAGARRAAEEYSLAQSVARYAEVYARLLRGGAAERKRRG